MIEKKLKQNTKRKKRYNYYIIALIFSLLIAIIGLKWYQVYQDKQKALGEKIRLEKLAQDKLQLEKLEMAIKERIQVPTLSGLSFQQVIATQPAKIGLVFPILADDQAVPQVKATIESALELFKASSQAATDEFYVCMQATRFSDEIVSFDYEIQTCQAKIAGKAHHLQTFNLKTGQMLTWADFLQDATYQENLKTFLLQKGQTNVDFLNDAQKVPFKLAADCVTFYGPNDSGEVVATLPLNEILDILKPEYVSEKMTAEAKQLDTKLQILKSNPLPLTPELAQKKLVALTFDDGPNPATTRDLLDLLKKEQVLATFFVLGDQAAKYPELVKTAADNGHQIGSHTMTHKNLVNLSPAQAQAEIDQASATISSIIGKSPTVLRPPYGETTASLNAAYNAAVILWEVDSLDWRDKNPDAICSKVFETVKDGSIILMHDIHPTTIAAVPRVIQELRRQGYLFVTVEQLINARTVFEKGSIYTRVKPQ